MQHFFLYYVKTSCMFYFQCVCQVLHSISALEHGHSHLTMRLADVAEVESEDTVPVTIAIKIGR